VVAEGVETDRQATILKAAGCTLLQGYLFSKPLPLADFEDYWRAHSATQTMKVA
jgi:EAL domain-containing protein (putative c-di-GMP-specific phosphodiesterase class I)